MTSFSQEALAGFATAYWAMIEADRPVYGRSGHWPKVRADWLREHPHCAACGGTKFVQVHHVTPYHLHPELELDPSNFITLCENPPRCCHFIFGHLFDWHNFNPEVREFSAAFLKLVEASRSPK